MKDHATSAGLIMAGFSGTQPDGRIRDLVREGLAGVILFDRNISTPDQLRQLTGDLQEQAARGGHPPLLVAVDHEGGRVQRLRLPGVTRQPAAMALGSAGDTLLTRRAAFVAARELRSLGINFNLAPCADVNAWPRSVVVGTRSFGSDPGAVAGHVAAYVRGAASEGLLTTAKHFPGHGATAADSHFDLPTVTRGLRELRAIDLVPFQAAIAAGVPAVMPGHLVVPGLTDGLPVTLSEPALYGLLRRELGFPGLVVSDCLEMAAISARYEPGEASVRAMVAGVDMLLWSHTAERQAAARDALAAAAAEGGIAARRLAAAHQRILALREALERGRPAMPDGGDHAAGAEVAAAIYRRAVRVVRDQNGLLPLVAGRPILVVGLARTLRSEPAASAHHRLSVHLREHGLIAQGMPAVTAGEGGVAVDAACAAAQLNARSGGICVLLSRDAAFDEEQLAAARRIVGETPAATVIAALGMPDDTSQIDAPSCAIATCDDAEGALAALAEVLSGRPPAAALGGY